jgi:hypothetical protein
VQNGYTRRPVIAPVPKSNDLTGAIMTCAVRAKYGTVA